MYKLLLTGADQIRHKIGKDNVLSLIGRALFFRFLCDRKIVTEDEVSDICETAAETSVHDTPRNIAKTFVDEAFDGLTDACKAKVLDPACGAGVFLVLAFRRLYAENRKKTGERPDTNAIRRILENQIRGLDQFWTKLNLISRRGYTVGNDPDKDATPMKELPDLATPVSTGKKFTVAKNAYAKFDRNFLTRTRMLKSGDRLRVYRSPLLLLRKSLPVDRRSGNALCSYVDIALNQDVYGYSANGHFDSRLLVQYLNLFAHGNSWT